MYMPVCKNIHIWIGIAVCKRVEYNAQYNTGRTSKLIDANQPN